MRRRQPCMQREHARFCAKADQHRKHRHKQQSRMSGGRSPVQRTACCKRQRIAVVIQAENTEQAEICATHRIKQIFQSRHNRLTRAIV